MRIPKGKSYKVFKTKEKRIEEVLSEFKREAFSGYLRATVEKEGELIDAFIVFEKGRAIAASYEGKEKLYGNEAIEKIKEIFLYPGICDVYSLSEFQLEITKEENPECMIKADIVEEAEAGEPIAEHVQAIEREVIEERKEEIEKNKEIEEVIEKKQKPEIPEKQEEKPEEIEYEDTGEDIKKRRLELLKKYGLREPDDSFADSIIKTFYMPADYEIAAKAKELKREIIKKIKGMKGIESADVYISTTKGEDTVEFSVDIYIKPLTEKIKSEIESLIESILSEKIDFPFQKEISVIEA